MVNEAPFDRWSWVHALNGLGLGLAGVSSGAAAVAAVAYEGVEYYHEDGGSKIFGTKQPESLANIVTDTALYAATFSAGRALRHHDGAGMGALAAFTGAAFVTWYISPLRTSGRS